MRSTRRSTSARVSSDDWSRQSCDGGVFMESFSPSLTDEPPPFDASDPLAPCPDRQPRTTSCTATSRSPTTSSAERTTTGPAIASACRSERGGFAGGRSASRATAGRPRASNYGRPSRSHGSAPIADGGAESECVYGAARDIASNAASGRPGSCLLRAAGETSSSGAASRVSARSSPASAPTARPSATSARRSRAHTERAAFAAPDSPDGGVAAPGVVRGVRPRPPLATNARPVRDPRLGGHAPADAGRPGRPAVRALARAVADGRGARRRLARRRHRRVAGARLQPSSACAPPRGNSCRGSRLARRPDRAAGRRAVHGGRAPELRLRRGRPPARRQRRAGRAAHGARVHRRCRAGADGSRRNRLPGADPAVRALPSRGVVPLTRDARRARAEAVALRGLLPAAPRGCPASRRDRATGRRQSSTPTPSGRSSATASSSSTEASSASPSEAASAQTRRQT